MATPVINLPQVGDPRHRGRRQAAGGHHRREGQRLDRDPPDDLPLHVVGPPRARRRAGGAVPRGAAQAAGVVELSELWVCNLGQVDYREGVALQERVRERVQAGELPDVMLLLEHPPVYTRGRRSDARRAADGRGLVPRPGHRRRQDRPRRQADLPRARASSSATRSCASTTSSPTCARWRRRSSPRWPRRASRPARARGSTGVWVEDRKIGSIGVHVSRGVTTHGFAINVDNDLQPFEWVVPCGLDGVRMTSVTKETGAGRPPRLLPPPHGARVLRGVRAAPAAR